MKIAMENGQMEKRKANAFFQYLAMITANLNVICSGMHYGWPSPSLPKLLDSNSHIPITNDEGSWMAVMPLIGAVGGSLLVAVILDIIGRKRVILVASIPFIVAWVMIACAKSVEVLIAARLLAGISDSLTFCAVPIYLGEISDPKIRGFIGASVAVTWILGTLLINIVGSYLSISVTAIVSASIPLLCLVTFLWMPESPYYLIMKGEEEEAKKSLFIFKGADIEDDLHRMVTAVKVEKEKNVGNFLDLFRKSHRRSLVVMLVLRGSQQLCGTSAITFYAQTIFEESNSVISPNIAAMIYFTVQVLLCSLSAGLVDRTGRRPLLIVSICGAGIALLTEGVYFYITNNTDIDTSNLSLIPVIALIVFVVLFSIGMQPIPILILGEIFATNVKAVALCFADIYFSVVATTVSKLFQFSKDRYGLHVPFFAFTLFCILGLLFIIYFVPETKGKTLEEIQDEFKQKSCTNQIEADENFKKIPLD